MFFTLSTDIGYIFHEVLSFFFFLLLSLFLFFISLYVSLYHLHWIHMPYSTTNNIHREVTQALPIYKYVCYQWTYKKDEISVLPLVTIIFLNNHPGNTTVHHIKNDFDFFSSFAKLSLILHCSCKWIRKQNKDLGMYCIHIKIKIFKNISRIECWESFSNVNNW